MTCPWLFHVHNLIALQAQQASEDGSDRHSKRNVLAQTQP